MAILALGVAAPGASADQTVVSATIYPGAQGSVTARSASLSQLQACAPYAGPNPIYLFPGDQPYQAPAGSTWTLAEALQCGLGIAPPQVSAVQVQTINRGFEPPLTSAGLTDPSTYQDPGAPGALPIIASDGAENQNTYVRPYRGGSDDNAGDEVVQSDAPIALLVYLNGSLLSVSASQQTVSRTARTRQIRLSTTVRDASGAPVPASALTWDWNFGDGHTSAAATPTHTFTAGVYEVSVQVADPSTGSGGTATLNVRFHAPPGTGTSNHDGGSKHTGSHNPTGSEHGSHKPAGGHSHSSQTSTTQTSTTQTSTTTTTATTTTTVATTATTSTTASTTSATPPAPRHRTPARAHAHRRTPVRRGTHLVTGQLVSDVAPLPSSASPLVHVTPAAAAPEAAVRQASRLSAAPAIGGALAVAVLLLLGAGRELRGRRRWRLDRPGGDAPPG